MKAVTFDIEKFHSEQVTLEPVIKRWMLQLLIELEGHKVFIDNDCFSDDNVAKILGLSVWINVDEEQFDKQKIIKELTTDFSKSVQQKKVQFSSPYISNNLALIKDLIGLNNVEVKLLLLVCSIHSFNALEKAADYIGDLNSSSVFHVLATLLSETQSSIRKGFSSTSALVKSGLVSLSEGEHKLDQKLDVLSSSFVDNMFSKNMTNSDILEGVAFQSSPAKLHLSDYQHINNELDVILPYLKQAIKTKRTSVNILVHGCPGTGKSQLIRVIAQSITSSLYEISSEDDRGYLMSGQARLKALMASQKFLNQQQAIIMLDEAEDIFSAESLFSKSVASENKAWTNNFLENNEIPVFWLSNSIQGIDPAFLRRFDFIFEVGIPKKQQRHNIIKSACDGLVSDNIINQLSENDVIAPAVIERASGVICSLKDELSLSARESSLKMIISNTLEAQGHGKLTNTAYENNHYDPRFVQADCNLIEVTQGLLEHGEGRLCLFGPPGTGKTAYGHYLAKKLDKPLVLKKASDLISKWVGGTEQNIANAFEQASGENAVLMLDEVDSYLMDRRHANQQWEVTQVNEMLTQMESFQGIFIASTNLMENLDQASMRRFDLKVKFDYLSPAQVESMFKLYSNNFKLSQTGNVRLAMLTNLTPGDFALQVRRHKFRPFKTEQCLFEALVSEASIKEGNSNQPIGFI